ncbi:MAG: hybrid sensor histidine kinase/response regulator [Bacteroidales bacterium]|nr:hybrid sensor histidine kinase/response regulator [Bacteroidales bacterium]MDD4829965.1 hybrid sensor histidine kinase/response regulator [Bacteroidales bacterium]
MEIINSNYKILIVDDVKANVMLLKALIKKNNYQILEAGNGKEALDMFELHQPDLILLDIMMPIYDGYQVIDIIRNGNIKPDVDIILITALDNKEDVVKGFNAGANDYISKPFNNEELEARIRHQISLIAAKKEIENKTKDLIAAIKNRDKLYSVIAHDLRSPLSSVKMIITLLVSELKDSNIDKDLFDLLNEANRTTENLFILLDNLLKWTKSQTGRLNISAQNIDIISIVYGLIDLYSLVSQNKSITIKVMSDVLNLEINSDPDIVKTIIRNLLSNAIKFSYPNSEVLIKIEDKEENVLIIVEDHGCGIQEDKKANLLADKECGYTSYGTDNEEGSGLGLSLCQEFTNKLGGEIWFESEFEKGSKFFVSLPKKLLDR